MKDTETKLAFIQARAEGKSYRTIQEELGIAKATCSNWERELRADIEALKREHMEELYSAYGMTREARIGALGDTLAKIDKQVEETDLGELSPKDLLELRIKYHRALKEEYIEPIEVDTDDTLDGLLEQYNQLYRESKTGKYSPADVKAQLAILDGKRDILYRLTNEQTREEENPLELNLDYSSKLIRHNGEQKHIVGNSKWKRPREGVEAHA